MNERKRFLLIPVLLLAGSLIGLAHQVQQSDRTPFPHGVHIENELECTDCHVGAEDDDQATLPTIDTCLECHDAPEDEESEVIAAWFRQRTTTDGELDLDVSVIFEDLIFSHKMHIALDAECEDCHGDVPGAKIRKAGTPEFKQTCIDCHTIMEARLDCDACHVTYSMDASPSDHLKTDFLKTHGHQVNSYFRELPEDRCFYCHKLDDCEQCHGEEMPSSHDRPLFLDQHGKQVRMNHFAMADAGCSACHDESGCNACHQRMEPRGHTVSFKNRTHGFIARIERQTCMVCHKQSFCIDCHTTVEPISHRGQFSRGNQNHCYQCHLPLQNNPCWTCHKSVIGHDTLPAPMNAQHSGVTSNACRVCHAPVPHADNGMDCTICH